jgi:hypothetical protein
MAEDDSSMPGSVPPEAPEADVLEQAQEVVPTPEPRPRRPGFEVPDADAWEQSQEVPVDDPDAWR